MTNDGEIAKKEVYSIDEEVISNEEAFDGFYAVCTNLEDEAPDITKIIISDGKSKNVSVY